MFQLWDVYGKWKPKQEAEMRRALTFNVIYTRLKNLALNMFEWEGLPSTMRPEYIERLLFSFGQAVFFQDKRLGLMALQAQSNGGMNVYGEWQKIKPSGANGQVFKMYELYTGGDKTDPEKQCVLIKNNPMLLPTHEAILWYTMKLVEIEVSLDLNIKQQKFPFFITTTDDNATSMKAIFKKIESDELAIYADKSARGAIEVLITQVPFIADKMADYRHDVWNEVNSFLGIGNANTDKRERLIKDEVNSNNEFIELNADFMLQARKLACEQINALYSTNISVKLREVLPPNTGSVYEGGMKI